MGHPIKGVTGSKPRVEISHRVMRAEAAAAKKRKKGKRKGSR